MAGWFPMDLDLQDKPEFLFLQAELEIDADLLVGKLWKFWGWFDEQTTDGVMPRVSAKIINSRIGVPGFAEAMEGAGWLVLEQNGARIPGFEKRHSNSAKQRLGNARRMARARVGEESAQNSHKCADSTHRKRTPPTPTKPNQTKPPSASDGSPAPRADHRGARALAAAEAAAVDALEEKWMPAVAAVRKAGPKCANGAILGAIELEHTPESVLEVVGVFNRFRDKFSSSGALVDRLTTVGPDTDARLGWPVDLPRDPVARAPNPALEAERARAKFIASLLEKGDAREARIAEYDRGHAKQGGTAA